MWKDFEHFSHESRTPRKQSHTWHGLNFALPNRHSLQYQSPSGMPSSLGRQQQVCVPCHSRHTRGVALRSHPLCAVDSTGGGGGDIIHTRIIHRKYKYGPHGPVDSHVYTSSNPKQLTSQDSGLLLDTKCMSLWCHTRQRKLAMPQTSSPTWLSGATTSPSLASITSRMNSVTAAATWREG